MYLALILTPALQVVFHNLYLRPAKKKYIHMKKIVLSLLMSAAFVAPAAAQKPAKSKAKAAPGTEQATSQSLAIGSLIPNEGAMLHGVDDRPISLMQAKTDKGLLVMFSCNTCPYVIKGQQRTNEAIELAKKLGIGMIILNSNEAQRESDDAPNMMMLYATEQHYTVPYVRDEGSTMADMFGATRTPEVFLFDKNGILVYKGAMEDNPAEPAKSKVLYLNNAMRQMVDDRPIAPAVTKSIGCSIKRRQ